MPSLPQSILAVLAVAYSLSIRAFAQIDLGTATPFGIVATSKISNTGATIIRGELGLYPNTLTSITGFPPGRSGTVYAADGVANQAHKDAQTAYNAAAALAQTTDLTGQNLGGQTLVAGTYHFSSTAAITGVLTLDGQNDPNAQFVFQIGSSLTTATASSVVLINGARACNVFWQVGSSATLGTTTTFTGNILASASIALNNGVTVSGGLYALTGAVTLIDDQVTVQQACTTPTSSLASTSSGGTMTLVPATSSSTVAMPVSPPSSLSPTLTTKNPTTVPSTSSPSTSSPSTSSPSTHTISRPGAGNSITVNNRTGSARNSGSVPTTLPTLAPSSKSFSISRSNTFASSNRTVTSASSSIVTDPFTTSTYYDSACSCTKTKIFPVSSVPTPLVEAATEAVTTINGIPCTTSIYYEANCSCTKTAIVPVESTLAPQVEAAAKAITVISGVSYTTSTYYKSMAATAVSTLASTQTVQALFSCMSACMLPYASTVTESFTATESCFAKPRYRM